MDLDALALLIVEIKPSVAGLEIAPDNSLVDDLGLDSLDILQLIRRIQRKTGKQLPIEDWVETEAEKKGTKFAVSSLLGLIET